MGICSCSIWNNDNQEITLVSQKTVLTQEKVEDWYTVDHEVMNDSSSRQVVQSKSSLQQYEIQTISKKENTASVMQELVILRKLDHPNIEKVHRIFDMPEQIQFISDFIQGQSLESLLDERENLSEKDVKLIAKEILNGLLYLHSEGICHRNLKLSTIFISSNWQSLKIRGFAHATHFFCEGKLQLLEGVVGSPNYRAPEMYNGLYSYKCDLWAVGVITYALLFGFLPFESSSYNALSQRDVTERLKIQETDISSDALVFLDGLLCVDSIKRLSCTQALRQHWVNNV